MTVVVKGFKLIVEEILARVEEETDAGYRISKPRKIGLVQTPEGRLAPVIVPWIVASPDLGTILLLRDKVVAVVDQVHPQLEKDYLQDTTGIALATA